MGDLTAALADATRSARQTGAFTVTVDEVPASPTAGVPLRPGQSGVTKRTRFTNESARYTRPSSATASPMMCGVLTTRFVMTKIRWKPSNPKTCCRVCKAIYR